MFWELLEQGKFSASVFNFFSQKDKKNSSLYLLRYMAAKGNGVKRGYLTVTEGHQ